jgi:uncharacterized protein YecE (DUF72 family)
MATGEAPHDAAHDPGVEEARLRAEAAPGRAAVLVINGGIVRVGTAGWTDPTLTAPGAFYPDGRSSAEQRLQHYASRFPLVEVDSTYYAIPARRMAELWVTRTPDEFKFNVKAHALMTGQPSETNRLPSDIRQALPATLSGKRRIYGTDLPNELRSEVWNRFRDAIAPLEKAQKLGAVLLQYPRWFMPSRANSEEILAARERLGGLPLAVEFRHGRWLHEDRGPRLLRWLADNDLSYVIVDQPQGLPSSVPTLCDIASPSLAIVRLHGRRAETWEKPGVGVLERFRYLYDEKELAEWVPRIGTIAAQARETHVIMNNCYANYGTTNAAELTAMLERAYPARLA